MVDYGNTKTARMHSRLGSATLSQLAVPGKATRISHGKNPIGSIQLIKQKKKKEMSNIVFVTLEQLLTKRFIH